MTQRESLQEYPDGIIKVDSEFGKLIGFTSDKFSGDSYLWHDGDRVLISLIFSIHPRRGNMLALFNNIEKLGLQIAVPTPLGQMESILNKMGFEMHNELGELGMCEVWSKVI